LTANRVSSSKKLIDRSIELPLIRSSEAALLQVIEMDLAWASVLIMKEIFSIGTMVVILLVKTSELFGKAQLS